MNLYFSIHSTALFPLGATGDNVGRSAQFQLNSESGTRTLGV